MPYTSNKSESTSLLTKRESEKKLEKKHFVANKRTSTHSYQWRPIGENGKSIKGKRPNLITFTNITGKTRRHTSLRNQNTKTVNLNLLLSEEH